MNIWWWLDTELVVAQVVDVAIRLFIQALAQIVPNVYAR